MNILFLSELFYPHGGGAEFATYLYAKLLAQEGSNVVVITNKFAGEPAYSRDGRLIVYRLPMFNESSNVKYSVLKRLDVLFSTFMKKIVKQADVVYIPRYWFLAIPLARKFEKPVIVHLHDYILICPLAVLYNEAESAICNGKNFSCSSRCICQYEKKHNRGFIESLASVTLNSSVGCIIPNFVKLADAIICVSKAQENIIVKREPSLRQKLYVIQNPLPEQSAIEIKGNDFGYFGGPDVLKGFGVLTKAMLNLMSLHPSLKIKVHSTKFDATNKRFFTNTLNKLGFLTYGKLSRNDLKRLYKQIRAVIVPSIYPEPWPYVVVEALIRGRFVIASNVGGIPEQVNGCKGTLLFEAGNYNDLVGSIEFVSNLSREEVTSLGIQNREAILKRFSNELSIRNFINVCEQLI